MNDIGNVSSSDVVQYVDNENELVESKDILLPYDNSKLCSIEKVKVKNEEDIGEIINNGEGIEEFDIPVKSVKYNVNVSLIDNLFLNELINNLL